ncbi:MAG: type IV toxin-antitoxin system AbiEi family antitoxin [Acidimicrobiales bacterium]
MVQAAVAWLREHLPNSWEVAPTGLAGLRAESATVDAAIDLRGPNGTFTTMIVEVKPRFGPRDVERLLTGVGRTLRALSPNVPILLVTTWLSRRSQELLAAERVNFLDLTGNSLIQLEHPTLYIETQGASKNPSPPPKNRARVQGPKAGRLIRLLVDVRPPYGVRALAAAGGLAVSYVSRLLDSLDDEALVERFERGRVRSVDMPRLIHRWAETYEVFRANATQQFLAPAGAAAALAELPGQDRRTAVTGSFAASRLAPVAAPTLLAIYADDPNLPKSLGLIPTDHGANVAVLRPFDPVVWERTSIESGITYVAPSQAAVDCLTGNGRMPVEGEALIQWLVDNENSWRLEWLPDAGQ